MAAPDPTEDSPPVTAWRPSARRRVTVLAVALLAAVLAIVVVITGPPVPVTFDMRLPLLVFAGGALATAVQWRRQVRVTADEVVLRTLAGTRRIPLTSVARVETDDGRITIQSLSGRNAVVRGVTGPSGDDLADAMVSAAGPTAHRAAGTPSAPVPLITPWVLMLLTIGTALLAAEGYATHPALVVAALGAVTAAAGGALGGSWLWERRRRETTSEPGG